MHTYRRNPRFTILPCPIFPGKYKIRGDEVCRIEPAHEYCLGHHVHVADDLTEFYCLDCGNTGYSYIDLGHCCFDYMLSRRKKEEQKYTREKESPSWLWIQKHLPSCRKKHLNVYLSRIKHELFKTLAKVKEIPHFDLYQAPLQQVEKEKNKKNKNKNNNNKRNYECIYPIIMHLVYLFSFLDLANEKICQEVTIQIVKEIYGEFEPLFLHGIFYPWQGPYEFELIRSVIKEVELFLKRILNFIYQDIISSVFSQVKDIATIILDYIK